MLALETGWTPDVIGDIPDDFRRACHWALYMRAIMPNGIPQIPDLPRSAPPDARIEAARLRVEINQLRTTIYPEDV